MYTKNSEHKNMYNEYIKKLKTESKIRTFFESSCKPIYITDVNKNLTYVNNAMSEILGYKKRELLQMKLHHIITKESFEKKLKMEKTELLKNEEINEKVYFLTKEGRKIPVDIKVAPVFSSEKKLIGSRAIFQDFSERRKYGNLLQESKERYQTLVENLPVGIAIVSEDGRIVSANDIALEIFGYDLQDLDWLTTFHLCSNSEDKDVLLQKITNRELVWNHEIQLKKKDGSEIQILANVKPILNSEGNYFLAAFNELNRKKINFDAETSPKENSEYGEPDYKLLAQMAYKIRTPIIIILNLNSAIRYEIEYKVDPETRSFFKEIDSACKKILRIVDLALEMSAIQSGKYEITKQQIDLNKDILEKLYFKFKTAADEKNINIYLSINTDETTVTADEFSTTQIFSYLIDNAIKYTDKGEIEIIVDKVSRDKLHISITDTGIGISNDYLPDLFSLFSQEKPDYTGRNEGAGLALALVKKYCELNGAGIYIESGKGTGSRFTISFNLNID